MKRATLLGVVVTLSITLSAGAALAAINQVECPNRPDGSCVGTSGDDNISGTNRPDDIGGGLGDDQVRAFDGTDTVAGGDGADSLYGDNGGDDLKGSVGNDFIVGGEGPDEIYGNSGNDRARGTDGNDTIRVAGDSSDQDFINCGAGTDTAYVDSNDAIDGVVSETIVVNTAFSCERIVVNGREIPTGV